MGLFGKSKERKLDEAVSRLFHYSFDEIDWDYNKLTTREKLCVSPKEFELIKLQYKKK
jgi:hypothetical protein